MNDDPPEPAIPAIPWITATLRQLMRLNAAGVHYRHEAAEALGHFLRLLEVDDFQEPRVEVVTPSLIRLAWCDGRRSLRLEVGPGRMLITTSQPRPARRGAGQAVDAARDALGWYRPPHAAPARRDES